MHVYLLVNVLLLGITVALWCQGKLPHTTPVPQNGQVVFESTGLRNPTDLSAQVWLMTGSALAMAGAFSFILLSIWMAMHPASIRFFKRCVNSQLRTGAAAASVAPATENVQVFCTFVRGKWAPEPKVLQRTQ